jgi:hypothetical protein
MELNFGRPSTETIYSNRARIRNDYSKPQTSVSGCLYCPNFSSCERLDREEKSLEAIYQTESDQLEPGRIKKIRILLEHFRRQKRNFPLVKEFRSCWYHNKFGVIESLAEQVHQLLKREEAS